MPESRAQGSCSRIEKPTASARLLQDRPSALILSDNWGQGSIIQKGEVELTSIPGTLHYAQRSARAPRRSPRALWYFPPCPNPLTVPRIYSYSHRQGTSSLNHTTMVTSCYRSVNLKLSDPKCSLVETALTDRDGVRPQRAGLKVFKHQKQSPPRTDEGKLEFEVRAQLPVSNLTVKLCTDLSFSSGARSLRTTSPSAVQQMTRSLRLPPFVMSRRVAPSPRAEINSPLLPADVVDTDLPRHDLGLRPDHGSVEMGELCAKELS